MREYLISATGNSNDVGKMLTVHLERPMDRDYAIRVVGEMASAFDLKKGNTTAEVQLPGFSGMDVRRENLLVSVSSSPFLEVTEYKYVTHTRSACA